MWKKSHITLNLLKKQKMVIYLSMHMHIHGMDIAKYIILRYKGSLLISDDHYKICDISQEFFK
jgi:hypothetical protein